MKRYNIKQFVQYINAGNTKSPDVFIANFDDFQNIRLESKPLRLGFYVFSLEYNVDSYLKIDRLKDIDQSAYIYYDKPNAVLEWDLNQPCKGFFLLLSQDCLNRYIDKNSFVNFHNQKVFLFNEEREKLIELFKRTYQEYNKAEFSKEILTSYAHLILSHINTFYKRYFEGKRPRFNSFTDKFNEELHLYFNESQNINNLPTVSFFAKRLNLSTNYFGDIIKKHTGISPKQHINNQVIRLAKKRLKTSDKPISEIAYSLGFEHQTYFTRFFKKEIGLTPMQFKKQ